MINIAASDMALRVQHFERNTSKAQHAQSMSTHEDAKDLKDLDGSEIMKPDPKLAI